jgi:hypothetical protein
MKLTPKLYLACDECRTRAELYRADVKYNKSNLNTQELTI